MKQITVISGKGGTGKTTITACLAKLARNFVAADCDVDAADLHLLLKPKQGKAHDFYSGKGYMIDHDKCTNCGKCRELCRFAAIDEKFNIDPISCDGCGACYFACPENAISVKDNLAGEYYISSINNEITPFVHANLHIAEDNSGKLVSKVRQEARRMAEVTSADYIIIDGPPGIGCPVNAAIVGVNLALVITEPTLSGIHDMERILDVAKHFKIASKVAINKYDINIDNTKKIEDICSKRDINCISKIPYSKKVVEALIRGKTILDVEPEHKISMEMRNIWEQVK
ncbi:MAG: ATP-binding protein [Candidatus Margulisbacteria bacterium]|nr:ATP-binding protein [Candidatus Margulisiibacteriota bacterium]